MKFNEIPKFVVNLERRPDRMESVKREMEYLGWEYERFNAIDTNTHEGITKSTLEIIKIAKSYNYDRVMIIEDDIKVMPYANDLIESIENQCNSIEFAIFNLAPTLDRPVSKSEKYDLLLDLTNLPEKKSYQRDIYGHNMIIFDKSIYDILFNIEIEPLPYYYPIDEFTFRYILTNYQSYSPILPIAPQGYNFSNISNGYYSNFYMQTYNWNGYSPYKIPNEFLDESKNDEIKKNKEYKKFYYVS